jgi:hypothetical protein
VPLNLEYIFIINIFMAILVQHFVSTSTTMVVAVVLGRLVAPLPEAHCTEKLY